jgi:hypothetical protein
MTSRIHPRVLLVEGKEDLLVLAELMEACGIPWPKGKEPIFIDQRDGVDKVLERGVIEARLKSSGLQALGILIDGDDNPRRQWRRVRERLVETYPEIGEDLPLDGLVHAPTDHRPRVGVWIMPDNAREGMLESML